MDFVSQMQSAVNYSKQTVNNDVIINNEEEKEKTENQTAGEELTNSSSAVLEAEEKVPVVEESSEGYRKQQMEKVFSTQGYLKTSDIADYLGCSPQMARNYVNDFEEFLTVEKTSGGHRKYSLEDAAKIYEIIKIRRDKGFTVEMTKEYLRTPNGKILAAGSETAQMEMLFQKLSDEVKKQVQESIEETFKAGMDGLQKSLDSYSSLMLEQKEAALALEHKNDLDKIKQKLDDETEQNQLLRKELEEKNKQIMRLIEEQDLTLKKLEERDKEPVKKKGFPWFNRKN